MNTDRLKFRVFYNGDYSITPYCTLDMNSKVWLDTSIMCGDGLGNADTDIVDITDKCIVEICTGLRDKNGNLIYEGDIIRFCLNSQGYILAYEKAVIWDDVKKGFVVQSAKQQGKPALKWSLPDPETHIIEIIGNAHTEE